MIIDAEIISQLYTGEYSERIYDNESPWNSQNWTWIKFTSDDYSEWCGHFRGDPRKSAISKVFNTILILISDYLFQIERETGELIELKDKPQYHNLTTSPNGSYILADYYNIVKISDNINNKINIISPIEMDAIVFKEWYKNKLEFKCDEFLNWD